MRTIKRYTSMLMLCMGMLILSAANSHAEEVIITVKNIENDNGNFKVHVFNSSKGFQDKTAYKKLTFSKKEVRNGTMTIRVTLPPGEYGISLLDDENKNGKMDFNMLHLPKEGFGFSDYYHTSFSKPEYDSFKFQLQEKATKNVTVKIRYL